MDPAEGAAWPTTPEGKSFVRTSSAGWGEADIKARERSQWIVTVPVQAGTVTDSSAGEAVLTG
jgi:hypothetical protein